MAHRLLTVSHRGAIASDVVAVGRADMTIHRYRVDGGADEHLLWIEMQGDLGLAKVDTPSGELFTFDSDDEGDMGLPWYRPARICHVVSGVDWGWRNGAGKRTLFSP